MIHFIRFNVVGIVGFALQTGALFVLTHSPHPLGYLAATAAAVELAVLNNFVWHQRWTWSDRPSATRGETLRRLVKFNMPDFKRGASTISQQLAKNLYLSSERSFMRKGQEAIITYFMERNLTKRRILELYLNVIEWGDGIYGAEAASQYYFHKPAASLNAREAAFLSAMIPNPRTVFNPQIDPKRVARRQRVILRLMPGVKMPPGTG